MRPLCAPSHLYGRTCGARVSFLCDCDGGAKHVLNLGFGGGRVAGVASSAAVLDRYLEDHEEKEGVGRAVFWASLYECRSLSKKDSNLRARSSGLLRRSPDTHAHTTSHEAIIRPSRELKNVDCLLVISSLTCSKGPTRTPTHTRYHR